MIRQSCLSGAVDQKLEAIITKKERLGLSFAAGAISRETCQKKLQETIKIEKDLLRSRDNLNPDDRTEIGDLDKAIASLEETLNSGSAKILLTELGVQVSHIPENWIVGHDSPGEVAGLENWIVIDSPNTLRTPEMGMTMKVVDGHEVNWNLEITRDTIWRNIREIFNQLNIKVYVFNDRIEIRGNIPTEIIDIPWETTRSKREPIICSARRLGDRLRFFHQVKESGSEKIFYNRVCLTFVSQAIITTKCTGSIISAGF